MTTMMSMKRGNVPFVVEIEYIIVRVAQKMILPLQD